MLGWLRLACQRLQTKNHEYSLHSIREDETAKARWFTPHQLQSFGVAGAIAKPFNPLSLTNEIANALGW